MRKHLLLVILILHTLKLFSSTCAFEDLTLTELLIKRPNIHIFRGLILEIIKDSNSVYSSNMQIIELYSGNIDSLKVNTINGKMYKTILLNRYTKGTEVLVFAMKQGTTFYAGGACDIWTKPYTGYEYQLSEIRIIKEFWDIQSKKKSGEFIFKTSNNQILASGQFRKGKQVKIWKNYYTNGVLKNEIDHVKNSTIQYFENGYLNFINTTFKDSSVCFTYSKEKSSLLTIRWITIPNDTGSLLIMYQYFENGRLEHTQAQMNYNVLNGSTTAYKTGIYADYYSNGVCKEIGKYDFDKKIGTWRRYDEYGKSISENKY